MKTCAGQITKIFCDSLFSGTKSGGSRAASNEGLGSSDNASSGGGESAVEYTASGMPTQDGVVRKTERITKKIQELLMSAQEGKYDR